MFWLGSFCALSDSGIDGCFQLFFALGGSVAILLLHPTPQVSDWEVRPLSDRQFRYACLDAYVLVQLYRHFEATLADFDAIRKLRTTTYVVRKGRECVD